MAVDPFRGRDRPVFDVDQPIETLLGLIAHGNQAAFVSLQRRMAGLVQVNIRRILRDAAQSDSATQATFDEIRDHAEDFDPRRDSAQTWLLKRAHQHAINGLVSPEPVAAPADTGQAPAPVGQPVPVSQPVAFNAPDGPGTQPDLHHDLSTPNDLSTPMRVPVLAMSTTASSTNKEDS